MYCLVYSVYILHTTLPINVKMIIFYYYQCRITHYFKNYINVFENYFYINASNKNI